MMDKILFFEFMKLAIPKKTKIKMYIKIINH